MPVVEVDGQEIEFPDAMSNDEIKSVLRSKFPNTAASTSVAPATTVAPQEKDYGRAAGLSTRAAISGVAGIPSTIADVMSYPLRKGVNLAAESMGKDTIFKQSPSEKFQSDMTNYGFPEPNTAGERIGSDVISGVTGGALFGMPISGATAAISGGAAREAGLPAWVQFLASMAGGIAPTAIGKASGLTSKLAGDVKLINPISSENKIVEALKPSRQEFIKIKGQEKSLWNDFNKNVPINTSVNAKPLSSISEALNKAVLENNTNLDSESMLGVKKVIDELSGMIPKSSIDVETGLPLITANTAKPTIGKLVALRQDLSAASMGNAGAKNILDAFDDALANNSANLLKGDNKQAVDMLMSAIGKSREKFARFGTNIGSGQRKSFEQFVTKSATSDTEAVKSLGGGTSSTVQAPQLISRLIKEGGDGARVNLGKSYIDRAIQKSTEQLSGGKTIINPKKLRDEITSIIESGADDGGLGSEVRSMLYSKSELESLTKLRNALKDPNTMMDTLKKETLKIPFSGLILSDPAIVNGMKTKAQVYKYLNSGLISSGKEMGAGTVATVESLKGLNEKYGAAKPLKSKLKSDSIPKNKNPFTEKK